jgi:hypothetical protein
VSLSWLFLAFFVFLFLSGMLSFLRRLDGPAKSADVSTTVSGKGRFLDEDPMLSDLGLDKEGVEGLSFFFDFVLEAKISSISDMVDYGRVM